MTKKRKRPLFENKPQQDKPDQGREHITKFLQRVYAFVTKESDLYWGLKEADAVPLNSKRVPGSGKRQKVQEEEDSTVSEGYGEATLGSVSRLMRMLETLSDESLRLTSSSKFVDIGSGFGKVVFHAKLFSGVHQSVGIEYVQHRHLVALHTLEHFRFNHILKGKEENVKSHKKKKPITNGKTDITNHENGNDKLCKHTNDTPNGDTSAKTDNTNGKIITNGEATEMDENNNITQPKLPSTDSCQPSTLQPETANGFHIPSSDTTKNDTNKTCESDKVNETDKTNEIDKAETKNMNEIHTSSETEKTSETDKVKEMDISEPNTTNEASTASEIDNAKVTDGSGIESETDKTSETDTSNETSETKKTDETKETNKANETNETDKTKEATDTNKADETSETNKATNETSETDKTNETSEANNANEASETDKAKEATDTEKTSETDKVSEPDRMSDMASDKTSDTEKLSETDSSIGDDDKENDGNDVNTNVNVDAEMAEVLSSRVEFVCGDATLYAPFNYTHIYMYDCIFSEGTYAILLPQLERSPFKVLVSFRTLPFLTKRGLTSIKEVGSMRISSTGRQTFKAHVYAKT